MPYNLPMANNTHGFDVREIQRDVKRYKALGDETRLKMFRTLQSGERCVCELMDRFKIGQSVASHHLKILENAGLITSRRSGKFVYYSIVEQDGLVPPDIP